jgi:hypothetical protein
MTSQEALFSGDTYRNFIYSIKSKATKTAYLKALKQFMQYRNVATVEELIRGEPKLIQSFIIEWIIDLKERRKLSYSSISLYCGALRHFYDMNDVTLNWKKIKSFLGEHVKSIKDRPYTRIEIQHLLEACSDQRLKIVILLMSSAGLRVGAIPSILIRNLTGQNDDLFRFVFFIVLRRKYNIYMKLSQTYIFLTQNPFSGKAKAKRKSIKETSIWEKDFAAKASRAGLCELVAL